MWFWQGVVVGLAFVAWDRYTDWAAKQRKAERAELLRELQRELGRRCGQGPSK